MMVGEQIWFSIVPAIAAAIYFFGGLGVYSVRHALHGEFADREMAGRDVGPVLGRWIRLYFAWLMKPLWVGVRRIDISASSLTSLSLLFAMGAGLLLAMGQMALGGWLFIMAGVLDFLDGRVARERGEAGPRGAALDSILDRFSDAAVLIGLAWFYRSTWVLVPVLLTVVGSLAISYVRARGEGLGVSVKVGLMQRPQRVALLSASLALTPLLDLATATTAIPHPVLVAVLVFLAAMTMATALQRLVHLLRALDEQSGTSTLSALMGRGGVVRALVASLVATGTDFLFVMALVSFAGLVPWFATALGCVVGGVVNFTMGRVWVFHAHGRTSAQAGRYVLISASSAGLNAAGVAIMALTLIDYRIAWLLVRAAVFLGWNFPMHRDFVFKDHRGRRAAEDHDDDGASAHPESPETREDRHAADGAAAEDGSLDRRGRRAVRRRRATASAHAATTMRVPASSPDVLEHSGSGQG